MREHAQANSAEIDQLAAQVSSTFQNMAALFGGRMSNMVLLELATRTRQRGFNLPEISGVLQMVNQCPDYLHNRPLPVPPEFPKEAAVREFLAADFTRAAIDLISDTIPLEHCVAGLLEAVLLLRDKDRELRGYGVACECHAPRVGVHISFAAGISADYVVQQLKGVISSIEAGEPAGGVLGDTIFLPDPDQDQEEDVEEDEDEYP
jgi:hypothetical protein